MASEQPYSSQLVRLQEEQFSAISQTDEQINQWERFKSDYKSLQNRLKTLPDKTTHDVMVPFGTLAFMPGQLIHTNEILVLLGDNWFAERSAKEAREIIDRRITTVDKQLEDLLKQKKLLEPRLDFTQEMQDMSQGQGETVEIQEDYDSDKEKQWREQHRQNIRENSKRKKQPRKSKKNIKTVPASPSQGGTKKTQQKDKDLWARLDELEAQETAQGELERVADESPAVSRPTDSRRNNERDVSLAAERHAESPASDLDSDDNFADTEEGEEEEEEEDESVECQRQERVIHFHHSSVDHKEDTKTASSSIESPADLYRLVEQSTLPKSILKPQRSTEARQEAKKERRRAREVTFAAEKGKPKPQRTIASINTAEANAGLVAVSQVVVEKKSPSVVTSPVSELSKSQGVTVPSNPEVTQPEPSQPRPVSKFKSQRSKRS